MLGFWGGIGRTVEPFLGMASVRYLSVGNAETTEKNILSRLVREVGTLNCYCGGVSDFWDGKC